MRNLWRLGSGAHRIICTYRLYDKHAYATIAIHIWLIFNRITLKTYHLSATVLVSAGYTHVCVPDCVQRTLKNIGSGSFIDH